MEYKIGEEITFYQQKITDNNQTWRAKIVGVTKKLFRKSDPDTSREAAEYVQDFIASHESMILHALRVDASYACNAGITKSECSLIIYHIHKFNLDSVQICRRMKKLEEDGMVIRTELKRKNASGRSETVWRLA